MSVNWYKIRAIALDEYVEDWLSPKEIALYEEGYQAIADELQVPVELFSAVRENEKAFQFGGTKGLEEWAIEKPQEAALISKFE